jgi:hypothetical protein
MEYTIKPSAERDNGPITDASKAVALTAFLDTFSSYTLYDLGPAMTCTEAEVLAELFVEHGRHDQADTIREGHISQDDHGDLNHNAGDYFKIGDPELDEDMPGMAWVDDEVMGLYPVDVVTKAEVTA